MTEQNCFDHSTCCSKIINDVHHEQTAVSEENTLFHPPSQPHFRLPSHQLFPQVYIPPIGIGTYELRGENCVKAVCTALQLGFRLIDTAAAYRNEALVGEGIRISKVQRKEIFVNVKIAMKSVKSEESIRNGVLKSIELLGIGYADAVLVHWPGAGGLRPEDKEGHCNGRRLCWKVMHDLQNEGLARCIGVSNYRPQHFAELLEMPWAHSFSLNCIGISSDISCAEEKNELVTPQDSNENENESVLENNNEKKSAKKTNLSTMVGSSALPVLNQIELHPLCVQDSVVKFCRKHHMHIQQYSPLGKGDERLVQHPELRRIQQTYFSEYSIADILLLWGLVNGFIPLVRSGNESHLKKNFQLAIDYFAPLQPSQPRHSDLTEASVTPSAIMPSRLPLTTTQKDILENLRAHLDVKEDVHLCWNSIAIA